MSRTARAKVACAITALCYSGPAGAGAFLQSPGEGIIIAQAGFSEARHGYDPYGRRVSLSAWRKFEVSTYTEFGLNDDITVLGKFAHKRFKAQGLPDEDTGLRGKGVDKSIAGPAELGARMKIFGGDGYAVSAQASLRYSVRNGDALGYSDMHQPLQFEGRLQEGFNFHFLGFDAFNERSAGIRLGGTYGHQLLYDETLGVRLCEPVLFLLQSYTTVTIGRIGRNFAISQKFHASLVYELTDTTAVQAGYFTAVRGVNNAAEHGIITAVWWKF